MPARSMAEVVNAGTLHEFCAWTTVSRCRYGRRRAAQGGAN